MIEFFFAVLGGGRRYVHYFFGVIFGSGRRCAVYVVFVASRDVRALGG